MSRSIASFPTTELSTICVKAPIDIFSHATEGYPEMEENQEIRKAVGERSRKYSNEHDDDQEPGLLEPLNDCIERAERRIPCLVAKGMFTRGFDGSSQELPGMERYGRRRGWKTDRRGGDQIN